MPTQQTASWLVRAAIVEQSIKRAVFSPFDRIQTLLQCTFRWCGAPHHRKVQGFCAKSLHMNKADWLCKP